MDSQRVVTPVKTGVQKYFIYLNLPKKLGPGLLRRARTKGKGRLVSMSPAVQAEALQEGQETGERLKSLDLVERNRGHVCSRLIIKATRGRKADSPSCSFLTNSPIYPLPRSKLGEKLGAGQAQDVIFKEALLSEFLWGRTKLTILYH